MNIYKIQSQLAQTLTKLVAVRDQMHSKGASTLSKVLCFIRCAVLKHKIQKLTDRLHTRGAS